MPPVTNGTTHSVDLDDGRMLQPGQTADVKRTDRIDGLIATGQLVASKPKPAAARKQTSPKSQPDPSEQENV